MAQTNVHKCKGMKVEVISLAHATSRTLWGQAAAQQPTQPSIHAYIYAYTYVCIYMHMCGLEQDRPESVGSNKKSGKVGLRHKTPSRRVGEETEEER